jgi:RNase P/RNase MRP subunit p30
MKDITLTPAKDALVIKEISSKAELSDPNKSDGYLLNTSEKEARRIIESLKQKKSKKVIAILGRDDAFNRRAIETLKIKYLVSPELGERRDTLKQRDSGLNHVIAKLAKGKDISIIIDFSSIAKLSPKEKALRLSRIIQNIKICRKAKCDVKIASMARKKSELSGEKERKSLAFSLGMSSPQTANCCNF